MAYLETPGTTEDLHARKTLVLAPHADDEVLGCGGLVARLARRGGEVDVLFLSDSAGSTRAESPPEVVREQRRREAVAAAEVLGVHLLEPLDLPDGALEQRLDELVDGLRRVLEAGRPELVLVPSPLERSADHRAAFAALHRLCAAVRPGDALHDLLPRLVVLAYEVNQPLYPNLLVDVGAERETLERAMACYASQQAQHDYLAARLGLLRYRTLTLPPDVELAEAYRRLGAEELRTRGHAEIVAELGGAPRLLRVDEGPRISVIVRTKDRPRFLAEALGSLARSTWRRTEVVVVNDGGEPPELPADYPLEIRRVDLPRNRGRGGAANAGVAAAAGDYIAFLDDDDLVEPEHLATLAALVGAAGVRVAYTDAAVGVYELSGEKVGGVRGWKQVERRLPYSRDFDPELLLFDNYIPFHTLLIERTLFDEVGHFDSIDRTAEGGPFDEDLPFFEDWDFLLRLAARTPFHHLPRVTCEYRQFRGAGHHILGDLPRERGDFLLMKGKVLARHGERRTSEVLARVVDRLRAETVVEQEAAARLRREIEQQGDVRAELEDALRRQNGKLVGLETHVKVLEETMHEVRSSLEIERREHVRLDQEVTRLYACERQLHDTLREQSLAYQKSSLEKKERIGRLEFQVEGLEASLAGRIAQVRELETEIFAARDAIAEHAEFHRAAEERLQAAYAMNGATDAKLRAMVEQERETAAELGRAYQEIERLGALIRRMESTRAWRLHQKIQGLKG